MIRQMESVAYVHSFVFGTEAAEELARMLVESTGGVMERVFVVSSGEFFILPFSPFG